ncbi:hypothetical protein Syun_010052 [Stephania yunnanensis]|uniref:Uncharacterized protein n=1 Tax=Stephania yunnanensis TaxID=152371 RepID=A0AAP0KHF0_9MAGN
MPSYTTQMRPYQEVVKENTLATPINMSVCVLSDSGPLYKQSVDFKSNGCNILRWEGHLVQGLLCSSLG